LLSQEDAIAGILGSFGLNKLESDIYVFLAKHGVLKCGEISKGMKRHTAQVYRALKTLQTKGLVESTLESPFRFTAIPFDKVIDLSIKVKHDEAATIERERNKVLDYWKRVGQPISELSTERFVVIEGNNQIYSRISQMVKETTKRFSAISSIQGILRADYLGVFDVAYNHPLKSEIAFRFLTELTDENTNQTRSLLKTLVKSKLNLKLRRLDIEKLSPRLAIKDDDEVLLFVTPRDGELKENKDDVCLWTNCRALVQAFSSIFENSWRNSIDVNERLAMQDSSVTDVQVTNDLSVISKRFENAFKLAQQKLMILTSAQGLLELSRDKKGLERAIKQGVSVKIMAPIINQNLATALQLSELCEVKHVSANYNIETLLVDDSTVVQLRHKEVGSAKEIPNLAYSNNLEYVNLIKSGLNGIWSRSTYPSTITLETVVPYGPSFFPLPFKSMLTKFYGWPVIDIAPPNMVSEKSISSRCIDAKKIVCKDPNRDVSRAYAGQGLALIHPPDYLNLPDMIIQTTKIDKQSSFGEEDWLLISLASEDKKTFNVVATAGDNPNSQGLVKAIYQNVNVQLLKKEEIQFRVHGNTMFAAWTVPIPLIPSKYVLPPACMIIEGYGEVKTIAFTLSSPSGFKHEAEMNYFDAFVTFFLSESRYSGPGTDAMFCRDYIVTNYPPNVR
jgi:sugar-specific transcriptional regulator TrmB